MANVRYGPVAAKFRIATKRRDVPIPDVRMSLDHQGLFLAIGLVLVAASESKVATEPLIAAESVHAVRMSEIAGALAVPELTRSADIKLN